MTEEEEIQLTVDLHAGMADGDQIRFEQVSDEAVGHIAGDLIFRVKQVPHEFFTRNGDDLSINMQITLTDALVGFSKTIEHLDGHVVTVRKDDVTYCSERIRIEGEGMPRKGAGNKAIRGDLYITFFIDFPRDFTQAQKDAIRKIMG